MKKLIFVFSILFLFFLVSCSDGVNAIMDEYNSHFEVVPEEENFDPDSMLLPQYTVIYDSYLVIPAPMNCTTCEWKMFDKNGKVVYNSGKSSTEKMLSLYISSKYELGVVYTLELSVNLGGEDYVDSSDIIIYSHESIDKK